MLYLCWTLYKSLKYFKDDKNIDIVWGFYTEFTLTVTGTHMRVTMETDMPASVIS
jgi:hypothetical protein